MAYGSTESILLPTQSSLFGGWHRGLCPYLHQNIHFPAESLPQDSAAIPRRVSASGLLRSTFFLLHHSLLHLPCLSPFLLLSPASARIPEAGDSCGEEKLLSPASDRVPEAGDSLRRSGFVEVLPLPWRMDRLNQFCYQPSPACLVVGTEASARISIKIFVKQKVVFKMRISL